MSIFMALALSAAQPAFPAAPFGVWAPTADYVTAGQDEPGYRRWVAARPWRSGQVAQFHRYLLDSQIAYVAPTWQLLRTASDWQRCAAEPYEVPPSTEWANIVQTLRFIRDYVIPAVGPVEPVSVYRNPILNNCAGGAIESVHMHVSAIDLVPLRPTGRATLISRLCAIHALHGARYAVGLGFYPKLRFHIDSWKYRTWGRSDAGTLACPRIEPAPMVITPIFPQSAPAFTGNHPLPPAVITVPDSIDPLAPR